MAGELPTAEIAPIAAVAAPAPVVEPIVVEPVVSAGVESPVEAVADASPAAAEPAEIVSEAKAEEPKPADAAPEPLKYEAFKLPEGLQAPEEQLGQFTGVLSKYGLTQEAGQELMDLHGAALKQATQALQQRQLDAFQEMRRDWREDFYRTAGNRANTLADDAKFAIHELTRDKKERDELEAVFRDTGAGDHKAVVRLLAAAGRRLRERSAPSVGVPARTQGDNPADRRYGRTQR